MAKQIAMIYKVIISFHDITFLKCIFFFQHLLSHTSGLPLRPFVCRQCDAGFPTEGGLDNHMKLHQPAT